MTDTTIMVSTAADIPMAIARMPGVRTTSRPVSETITVVPEKSTACPAVDSVRPTAAARSSRVGFGVFASSSRNRVAMNSE